MVDPVMDQFQARDRSAEFMYLSLAAVMFVVGVYSLVALDFREPSNAAVILSFAFATLLVAHTGFLRRRVRLQRLQELDDARREIFLDASDD